MPSDTQDMEDLHIEEVLEILKKEIEKYNPDNKLVKDILQNLNSGKSALEGISNPAGVPIEEKPEEIEK